MAEHVLQHDRQGSVPSVCKHLLHLSVPENGPCHMLRNHHCPLLAGSHLPHLAAVKAPCMQKFCARLFQHGSAAFPLCFTLPVSVPSLPPGYDYLPHPDWLHLLPRHLVVSCRSLFFLLLVFLFYQVTLLFGFVYLPSEPLPPSP